MTSKSIRIFTLCLLALAMNVSAAPDPEDQECRSKNNITKEIIKEIGNDPLPDRDDVNGYSTCLLKKWNVINADGSLNRAAHTWKGVFRVPEEASKDYPMLVCLTKAEKEVKEKQGRVIVNCINEVFAAALGEALEIIKAQNTGSPQA